MNTNRIMVLLVAASGAASIAAQTSVTKISVDATESTRRLYHVKMTMPVTPGPLTLFYPEWIPGEHGPTGPITDLVGIKFSANGNSIPWRRDLSDMYTFQVTIPQGVNSIDISLEYIAAPETAGFSSAGSTTDKLAILSWNQMLLYPKGASPDQMNYQADLKVPPGWRYGTALPIETESGQNIQFKPSSLTTL